MFGLIAVSVGDGARPVTVKVTPPDVNGPGLTTVTVGVPADATSVAGIAALSWVAETNVVATATPFQSTTEVARKCVPFTVKVKAAAPAVAEVGEMVVMVGATAAA